MRRSPAPVLWLLLALTVAPVGAQRALSPAMTRASWLESTTVKNRSAFLEFIDGQRRTMLETADAMPVTKPQHIAYLRAS